MTPAELSKELAAGKVRPAYLLAGAEALLRDDALAALRGAVLGEGPSDFNFDRLDGDRVSPGALSDSVNALPVMAARRLVVLREPEARRGAAGAALSNALAELLPALTAQNETVLVVVAAKVDKRHKWVKAFRAPAALVACEPPRDLRAAAAFARAEAKRRGIALGGDAAEALAQATGTQLLLLRNEIEKASLLAGPGETVTRAHVMLGVSSVAEEPIWDLTDAVGQGRTADALGVLRKLLDAGAPPPVLLASLATHFRKLLRAKSGDVAGHPFVVRKLKAQSERYRPQRLRACLGFIHDLDEILKGRGGLPGELSLERLVIALSS